MSTDQQAAIKRRGRPPKAEADRKSTNLKFRTRGGLRERLELEAEKNNRSLSEEVEHRIEFSFIKEEIQLIEDKERNFGAAAVLERYERLCGGPENFDRVIGLGHRLREIMVARGFHASKQINELPEEDRRQIMTEFAKYLPAFFGVFD